MGKLDEALKNCDEALRLKPDYIAALDSRGLLHLKMGDIDASIADYDAALQLAPKYASSLNGCGLAKNKKETGTTVTPISTPQLPSSMTLPEIMKDTA